MHKFIILATLMACCMAAPADPLRRNNQFLPRPNYANQFAPQRDPLGPQDSIESDESWGVDKRDAPETEQPIGIDMVTEDIVDLMQLEVETTENPDLERIRAVNGLAVEPSHGATFSSPIRVF